MNSGQCQPTKLPALYVGLRTETSRSYSQKDVQLHALGCGRGLRPRAAADLVCLIAPGLVVLPAFAMVLGHGAGLFIEQGINWGSLVLLSQDLECLGLLPEAGVASCTDTVTGLAPKIKIEATIVSVATSICIRGELVARLNTRWLVRGFLFESNHLADLETFLTKRRQAGLLGVLLDDPPGTIKTEILTSPQSALIFRLLGGHSPLHSDPSAARAAGFDGPIMHGQSIFGHALATLAEEHADFDLSLIRSIGCDFVGVLYPGEKLTLKSLKTSDGITFEAFCTDRSNPVLRSGRMTLS